MKTKPTLYVFGIIVVLVLVAVSIPTKSVNDGVYQLSSGLEIQPKKNWSVKREIYSNGTLLGYNTINGESFSINLDGRTIPPESDVWPDIDIYNFELSAEITAEDFISNYLTKIHPGGKISGYQMGTIDYKVYTYENRYFDPVRLNSTYVSTYKGPTGVNYALVAVPYAIDSDEVPEVLERITN